MKAVLFLVVLGVAIAGLYGWAQASQSPPVRPGTVSGVSLVVDGGTWSLRYGPVTTTNNTAFGLLLEASQRLHFPVEYQNYTLPAGVFVVSINGTANMANGAGWQYWVGTSYGDRAANLYPLTDGSNVTWRYTANQGGA
jgi:hypothetical protein